jgi:hypothetical protein
MAFAAGDAATKKPISIAREEHRQMQSHRALPMSYLQRTRWDGSGGGSGSGSGNMYCNIWNIADGSG